MARMKREQVIEALRAIPGLDFDENDKYDELCKILKAQTGPDGPPSEAVTKSCVGCVDQEICHPDGVHFDSRPMASTCAEWRPTPDTEVEESPNQIRIVNRLKKRNTFLGDSVRDQRDTEFLHKEIGQRKYKGKLLRVTTVKEYEVSADGYWVTSFTIDLKD